MKSKSISILIVFVLLFSVNAIAQDDETHLIEDFEGEASLAQAAQNPIASMISLPLQNNTNFGFGEFDRTQNVLNIQPVIPFRISPNWNLINRTIIPVITQPDFSSETGSNTGLSDINFSAFFSPSKASKFIWGVGPAIIFPTATSDNLGSGKWSAGPTVVGLTMQGSWVIGLLVSNVWSFAGNSDRDDVNFFFSQYFINYNMNHGWYLTSAPIITGNWMAEPGNQWIVPFGGGPGKIFRLGKQPMNINVQAFYNVVKPDFGPDWQFRFALTFLFPK